MVSTTQMIPPFSSRIAAAVKKTHPPSPPRRIFENVIPSQVSLRNRDFLQFSGKSRAISSFFP